MSTGEDTTRFDGEPGPGVSLARLETIGNDAELELEHALERLEAGRGLLVRLADLMGGALGRVGHVGLKQLGMPAALQAKFRGIVETALVRALDVAVVTIPGRARVAGARSAVPDRIRPRLAQAAVAISGAAGGMTGLAGFVPDIGFTTVSIMREIARIAAEEGEDLASPDARRACLEVFALRGVGSDPTDSGVGYYSARMVMRGTPMVMLISEVASRYGLALGEKFAFQMVPVAGALCGASLNAAFLAHYQELARAHFTIRRLERAHGPKVRDIAERIRERMAARIAGAPA